MTIGLIAGGPGEEKTLKILARRVLESEKRSEGVESAKTRGEADLFIASKVKVMVRNLMDTYQARKVVICVDSHSDNQGTHEKAKATKRGIARLWGVRTRDLPVDYVVIVHELEGWLLADEGALNGVLGKNAKFNLPGNLESHCNQAELLKEIYRQNGKPDFTKTKDNPDIASKAEPSAIAARMSSFRQFVAALKDP